MSASKIGRGFSAPDPAYLVFVLASAAYLLYIAPGLLWMDVGELSVAAALLGGAHPPGHPAHSLLGKLAILLPIGEVATRLSLISAIAAGASLAAITRLTRVIFPKQWALSVLVVLPMALAPALLLNATRPEVYTPTFALLCWAMVFGMQFILGEATRARDALISVFLMALAATFHPAIALTIALPMSLALVVHAGKRSITLAPIGLALTLLAALLYLYLPTRALALHAPPLMWGDPGSVQNFYDLVTASVYQENFAASSFLEQIFERMAVLSEGTGLLLCLAGYAGLAFGALTRLRGATLLFSIALLIPLAAGLQSTFNPDMSAYLAMSYVPLTIGVAIIAVATAKALPTRFFSEEQQRWATVVAVGPFLLFTLMIDASERQELDDSDNAMQLWDETIGAMPPGPGVFFASGDPLLFVAQYETLVAGARPDIAIANPELVRDRWFMNHLRTRLPAQDLYLPFVDDGRKGQIAERLYWENARRGRPVWADALSPIPAHTSTHGRVFQLLAEAPPPNSESMPLRPLAFTGFVGRRVAGLMAIHRARYEAARGKFDFAAQAIDVSSRFVPGALQGPATRPSLLPHLPKVTAHFLYDDSERELLVDDITWQLGMDSFERSAKSVAQQIHFAWRLLLTGHADQAEAAIAAIGKAARMSTAPMLVAIGQIELAETRLRQALVQNPDSGVDLFMLASLLANKNQPTTVTEAQTLFVRATKLDPSNDEAWTRLGLVCAQLQKWQQARAAWQEALRLAPSRQDVQTYLQRLDHK